MEQVTIFRKEQAPIVALAEQVFIDRDAVYIGEDGMVILIPTMNIDKIEFTDSIKKTGWKKKDGGFVGTL